jgi:transcriptional regulator with XRE-family HTH domain
MSITSEVKSMRNVVEQKKRNESAGEILRFWRKFNRISQMDLALDAGVSSKHLSFVEAGKSHPSRNMILKLADSLKIPLRQRNVLLKAAGYASVFGEEPLSGQKMEMVRQALQRMIEKHEPYPALVVNAGYKILMKNVGFQEIVKYCIGEEALRKYENVYLMTFAHDGLRQYIEDWPVIEHFMLARLWEEAASTQNPELTSLYEDVVQLKSNEGPLTSHIDSSLPIMSLTLKKGSMRAKFFTTITTLGTPLDLTTQELRIESLFPADEETKRLFPLQA